MFSLPIRIIVVVLAAACGIYKLSANDPRGYVWLTAGLVFTIGYFRYGPIRPAFMAMQRGDLTTARSHIATIRFPKLLSSESQAYLHWIQGVLAAQEGGNLSIAEEQMQLALHGAIRTSHDRCLATATLAQIVAKNRNHEGARRLLAEAEQIPHRSSASEYLAAVKTELDSTE